MLSLREKCPNTEFFLVRIFLHSDWIRRVNLPIQFEYEKIRTRKNCVYGHVSHSVMIKFVLVRMAKIRSKIYWMFKSRWLKNIDQLLRKQCNLFPENKIIVWKANLMRQLPPFNCCKDSESIFHTFQLYRKKCDSYRCCKYFTNLCLG